MRIFAICSIAVLVTGATTVVADDLSQNKFSFETHRDARSQSEFGDLWENSPGQKTSPTATGKTASDLPDVRNYQDALFGSSPILSNSSKEKRGNQNSAYFTDGEPGDDYLTDLQRDSVSKRSNLTQTAGSRNAGRQPVVSAEFRQTAGRQNSQVRQVNSYEDDFFPFDEREADVDRKLNNLNDLELGTGPEFGLEVEKQNNSTNRNSASAGDDDFDLFGDTATPSATSESEFSLESTTSTDDFEPNLNTSPQSEPAGSDFQLDARSPAMTGHSTSTSTSTHRTGMGADAVAPSVKVYWEKQGSINVGEEFECRLVVENDSKTAASNVNVEAFFPATVRLVDANPRPVDKADRLAWSFEQLAGGQREVIRVLVIPNRAGDMTTRAQVQFTGAASGTFTVEQPMLTAEITGPDKVILGESAAHVITLSNPGTGVAHNVVLEARISAGLEHPRGEKLVMPIGSLSPAEKRVIRLPLSAIAGGMQNIQLVAKADSVPQQTAGSKIDVIAPSIQVAIDGPSLRYIGRNAKYILTATNSGEAASSNVRLLHKLPEGFEFVSADKDGKYDQSRGTVSWFVGRLEAGEATTRNVEMKAINPGEFTHRVGVISEHGVRSEAVIDTHIEGTASLVLEIVDLDDPVEVGVETAYEVRVRNDGTAAAQNVEISCELPEGVQLIDAKGPTSFKVSRGTVNFVSLGELPTNKTAIYQIRVQGAAAGNHRFRARMSSDSIQKPLIFEELTKFYQGE